MDSKRIDASSEAGLGSTSLEGDSALLTREWTLPELPELTDKDVVPIPEPPPPPSQRRFGPAAAAKASARPATVIGGAASPGAGASPQPPLITVPRKPRIAAGAPPRLTAPASLIDLATTLPPRGERFELPSVECEPSAAAFAGGWLARVRQHRAAAGAATLACALAAYAGTSRLSLTTPPPPSRLPPFLERSAQAAAAAERAAVAPPVTEPEPGSAPPAPPLDAASKPAVSPPARVAPRTPPDPAKSVLPRGASASASDAPTGALGASPVASPSPVPPGREALARARLALATAGRGTSAPAGAGTLTPTGKPAKVTASASHRETRVSGEIAEAPTATGSPLQPLTTYTYTPTALYRVTTAPERVTDLALQPGEKLTLQPTAGDAARWVVSVGDTVLRDEPQQHVFVKPLRPGITTNLTLTTNRRSYHLELSSAADGRYLAAVDWKYPLDDAERHRQELVRMEQERQSSTAVANLNALRFDYSIRATSGSPSWKPFSVFDDGEKTFIRFPEPVSASRAPLLFVLRAGSTRAATYVNYRIKGDLYVLDRQIDTAELRLSESGNPASKRQDVVRITRQ